MQTSQLFVFILEAKEEEGMLLLGYIGFLARKTLVRHFGVLEKAERST
jgi:hypothetical protein